MPPDFENSIILGYGPTEQPECQVCDGDRGTHLTKGFGFLCRDLSTGQEFVAGSDCRKKIDKRPLSAIPRLGATKPIPESTGRPGKNKHPKQDFTGAADETQLIANMSAWTQLRQKELPDLGFVGTTHDILVRPYAAILANNFTIEMARQVKRTYDSITKSRPEWELHNLQKCRDVAMQINRVAAHPGTTARDFLISIKSQLTSGYSLKEGQLQALQRVSKYWGEPEWTRDLKFS